MLIFCPKIAHKIHLQIYTISKKNRFDFFKRVFIKTTPFVFIWTLCSILKEVYSLLIGNKASIIKMSSFYWAFRVVVTSDKVVFLEIYRLPKIWQNTTPFSKKHFISQKEYDNADVFAIVAIITMTIFVLMKLAGTGKKVSQQINGKGYSTNERKRSFNGGWRKVVQHKSTLTCPVRGCAAQMEGVQQK